MEFFGFGHGRTGHAGQLFVQAEIVLERNGRQRHAFLLDFDAFFGFDGLVQAFVVAAAGQQTAGEFVDDDDFAVLGDDVIFVALEQCLGPQRLLQVINGADVLGGVEVVDAEGFFDLFDTLIGQDDGFALFVGLVMLFFVQLADDFGELGVGVTAGDARCAR